MKIDERIKSMIGSPSIEAESIYAMAFRYDLGEAYDKLPLGARVVISNIAAHLNGAGDLRVRVGGEYSLFLRPVQAGSFTLRDYVNWLEEAGFTKIQLGPHPYSLSILVAVK